MKRNVGFIVEGHGEFSSYPSLYCRISDDYSPPIQNAGGYSNIVIGLAQELHDLLITADVKTVIVTVDLDDCIKDGHGKNEVEVREKLQKQIDQFLLSAKNDDRIRHKLPDEILVIFQIMKFESWLISDVVGLKAHGLVAEITEQIGNVDLIPNPSKWLKENYINAIGSNMKSPKIAKAMISASDPSRMKLTSASFNDFQNAIINAQ